MPILFYEHCTCGGFDVHIAVKSQVTFLKNSKLHGSSRKRIHLTNATETLTKQIARTDHCSRAGTFFFLNLT
jgi:hypothetical protein